jgi:hypothetical protein
MVCDSLDGDATLSGFRLRKGCVVPGLPKRNPGLEFANAFSVKSTRMLSDGKRSSALDDFELLYRRSHRLSRFDTSL